MILTEQRLEFLLDLLISQPEWCSKTPQENKDAILAGIKPFREYWDDNHTDPTCTICEGSGCTIHFTLDGSNIKIDCCTRCNGTGQVNIFALDPEDETAECRICDGTGRVEM